ncbi:O-antigen ligase family protein [Paenibacillus sp. S-38]|uniref:O-antigen ligase family protein n=1 Tax=Paenibacillus sp. S-38 TaxID=3416710 RepID=UPI003CEB0DAF
MNPRYVPNHTNRLPLQDKKEDGHSLLYLFLMGCVLVFLAAAPFGRALFLHARSEHKPEDSLAFNSPLFSSYILVYLALGAAALLLFFRGGRTGARQNAPLLLIWCTPLAYLIPGLLRAGGPVSDYMFYHTWYAQMMFAAFFVFGLLLSRNGTGSRILQHVILLGGYAVVLYGLLGWYGLVQEYGLIISDANGIRLTSSFTYANSYAAYLMAVILGSLFLSVMASSAAAAALHSFFLVPALLSLAMTLSRGGFVLLPLVLLLLLPLITFSRQVVLLAQLGAAVLLAALLTSSSMRTAAAILAGAAPASALWDWLLLLAASLACTGAALLLKRGLEPRLARLAERRGWKHARLQFPVLLLLLGCGAVLLLTSAPVLFAFLPDAIRVRVENINFAQHSVQERGYFYADALRIFKEHWLAGTGGGGWASLYPAYQSYGYSSKQAHNFILQTLIDAGLIGTFMIFGFIAWIFAAYVRHYIRRARASGADTGQADPQSGLPLAVMAAALLLHSFMDFDMSYAFLSALFYLCLGGMAGVLPQRADSGRYPRLGSFLRWGYPAALAVLSLSMLFVSFSLKRGNNEAAQAIQLLSQPSPELAPVMEAIDSAIALQPSNADYVLIKIKILDALYSQTQQMSFLNEAASLLAALKEREPYAAEISEYGYTWARWKGEDEEALSLAREAIGSRPWAIHWYERAEELHYLLGEKAGAQGDLREQDRHWDQVQLLAGTIDAKHKELDLIPKSIAVPPFEPTPGTRLQLARVEYRRGDYAGAADLLRPVLPEDLKTPGNRLLVRWYTAAVQKLGKEDAAWRDRLLAADGNEQAELQRLLSMGTQAAQ